jgi:uncharacterized delta-60 repeat protein
MAIYDGTANFEDRSKAIVIDNAGNVYVTGLSSGTSSGLDIATIKYNSDGIQQWVSIYNYDIADYGFAIAVDVSGNVYITGKSLGLSPLTNYDYVTVKYNINGVQQWTQRYNGPGSADDEAYSVKVDNSGNVFVTGKSSAAGINFDYVTIKYNSSGVQQWVSRYNGPGNDADEANALVLDESGNVYITGRSWASGNYFDYATIMYNSSGVQQWASRYNGPVSYFDEATSIARDASGNIYVTGSSYESISSGYDYATIKYNSLGVQQWVSRYNAIGNSSDEASSIVIDLFGNIYVTGKSMGNGSNYDYATIRYNSSGTLQWQQRYNGPGNGEDGATSIGLDPDGNVYVTGGSDGGSTSWDYATIKYSQTVGLQNGNTENPAAFRLHQNYPNPFNPSTNISFEIPNESDVELTIYDVQGKKIKQLVNERMTAGNYNYRFDAVSEGGLTSGVYFYKLISRDFVQTRRMVLIK